MVDSSYFQTTAEGLTIIDMAFLNLDGDDLLREVKNFRTVAVADNCFGIKNYGISTDIIAEALHQTRMFFNLSEDEKVEMFQPDPDFPPPISRKETRLRGYMIIEEGEQEIEQYHILEEDDHAVKWPRSASMPGFRKKMERLSSEMHLLGKDLLKLILANPDFEMEERIQKIYCAFHDGENNDLVLLKYPAINEDMVEATAGDITCGFKHDIGTLTLTFQEPTGGLEYGEDGEEDIEVLYKRAAPAQPDLLFVHFGDYMQYITEEKHESKLARLDGCGERPEGASGLPARVFGQFHLRPEKYRLEGAQ